MGLNELARDYKKAHPEITSNLSLNRKNTRVIKVLTWTESLIRGYRTGWCSSETEGSYNSEITRGNNDLYFVYKPKKQYPSFAVTFDRSVGYIEVYNKGQTKIVSLTDVEADVPETRNWIKRLRLRAKALDEKALSLLVKTNRVRYGGVPVRSVDMTIVIGEGAEGVRVWGARTLQPTVVFQDTDELPIPNVKPPCFNRGDISEFSYV